MDKILIQVYVPVLNRSFDMFIPRHLPMYDVLALVKQAVADLSDGSFCPDDNTVLSRREDGSILNINGLVCELDIQNGSKLMLI